MANVPGLSGLAWAGVDYGHTMHPKPPIGVMPQKLWLEDRCRALEGAISRQLEFCMEHGYTPRNFEVLHKWALELEGHREKLKTVTTL